MKQSLVPTGIRIPERPARSQSPYRLRCLEKWSKPELEFKAWVLFFILEPTRSTIFPNFYFVKKLYMFRAFPLPIIRSFLPRVRHWYISCRFDNSFQVVSGWNCSSILTLLGSCHQICKKYTNAERTVENSWWWAKEMPETCRVFWQNKNLGKLCVWLVLL